MNAIFLANPFQGNLYSEQYRPVFVRCFVFSICLLFFLVHTPIHFLYSWYDKILLFLTSQSVIAKETSVEIEKGRELLFHNVIIPLRTFLFFISAVVIAVPLYRALRFTIASPSCFVPWQTVKTVLLTMVIVCCLVIPMRLGIMGVGYAQMSFHPLGMYDPSNQLYQRILMPAAAYFFQLQGPILFFIFSLFLTALLVVLVHYYFLLRGMTLSLLESVSICTSSFIMTQIQSPGYTEQLAYVFLLLFFLFPLNSFAKYSIVVFALLSHEISGGLLAVIAFFTFSKTEKIHTAVISVLYGIMWSASFGFNTSALIAARNVGETSALWWIFHYPWREFLGIVISYKFLWLILFAAIYSMKSMRTFLLAILFCSFLFTLGGVDTSRLMGYAFLALLPAFYVVKKYSILSDRSLQLFLWLNILTPSFYVGINAGVVSFNGIYQLVYMGNLVR